MSVLDFIGIIVSVVYTMNGVNYSWVLTVTDQGNERKFKPNDVKCVYYYSIFQISQLAMGRLF